MAVGQDKSTKIYKHFVYKKGFYNEYVNSNSENCWSHQPLDMKFSMYQDMCRKDV